MNRLERHLRGIGNAPAKALAMPRCAPFTRILLATIAALRLRAPPPTAGVGR